MHKIIMTLPFNASAGINGVRLLIIFLVQAQLHNYKIFCIFQISA